LPGGHQSAKQIVFAWAATIGLTILIPDYRVLMAVAYAPIFLLGAPVHWPPVSYFTVVSWPVLNQMLCAHGVSVSSAHAVDRMLEATPDAPVVWLRGSSG
jgi:hypothetical protein